MDKNLELNEANDDSRNDLKWRDFEVKDPNLDGWRDLEVGENAARPTRRWELAKRRRSGEVDEAREASPSWEVWYVWGRVQSGEMGLDPFLFYFFPFCVDRRLRGRGLRTDGG